MVTPTSLNPLGTLRLREYSKKAITSGIQALGPISHTIEEYWTDITLPDGWKSRSLVVRPKSKSPNWRKSPLVVYFYGGGFTAGSPAKCTQPARDFAEKLGAVVVCPDYRLVPEYRWPVPMQDAYHILQYLAENAGQEFGACLESPEGGFVVGGVSAGATIAAAAAGIHIFGDKKNGLRKPITGLCLCIPWLLVEEIVPEEFKCHWNSREENKMGVGLSSANVQQIRNGLQPDVSSGWFSPFNVMQKVRKEENRPIPPVYLQAGGLDSLRDDAVVFERALASRGARTRIDIFPGDGHVSWTVSPERHINRNPTIKESLMSGMDWLLHISNATHSHKL
ncbi:alpha/beta-hydrolase [Tothia fuscella]|uniref:Alpha/beta-hydrolase n=1 Tax=Tothia fuscella TaxID=1048955 RepID=A0A9P4NGS5_9PEZI|nr:alpha/beta-hydrolase [Tothia fuscella]